MNSIKINKQINQLNKLNHKMNRDLSRVKDNITEVEVELNEIAI